MSRLARCSKDWHQLLEICALFGTLIADLDGTYDPSQYNDRLLLGLKGTMSEAELHILKQRMVQGKRNKAKRGELGFSAPIGYVRHPSGEIRFDPDEQTQRVVKLIFRKFEELGTLNAVLRYLVSHRIQLGVRVLSGLNKGDLEWRKPSRATLQNLIKSPIYTGAYAYGRKQVDARRKKSEQPYSGLVIKPMEEWLVLIKDHHPAYISWAQYEQHLDQLKSNRTHTDEWGHARSGVALLSRLLVCGRCGSRMTVRYRQGNASHQYVCCREAADYGGPLCQQLAGTCIDESVTEQVLHALKPAALELSLAAATHIEQDRSELDKLWHQRLERASFESERSGRHYRLIEPENRLVARQLAQEWENALQTEQQLKEEYERFSYEQPKQLTDEEKKEIRHLAESFPRLWSAETATHAQRKEIVRQVIQKITVNIQGESEQVQVSIEWNGGFVDQVSVIRPVARWTQLSNYSQLCQRLVQMAEAQLPTDEMIELLHTEGFHPPRRRKTFNSDVLRSLMRRLGLGTHRSPKPRGLLTENEWWLPELATALEMPEVTLYNWVRRGWVNARQQPEPPKHWIVWADETELERLRAHRERPVGEVLRLHWKGGTSDITKPPETH